MSKTKITQQLRGHTQAHVAVVFPKLLLVSLVHPGVPWSSWPIYKHISSGYGFFKLQSERAVMKRKQSIREKMGCFGVLGGGFQTD